MLLIVSRRLEGINAWFPARTLEVRLRDLPAEEVSAPSLDDLVAWFDRDRLPPTRAGAGDRLRRWAPARQGWADLLVYIAAELQFQASGFTGAFQARLAPRRCAWRLALTCREFPIAEVCFSAALEVCEALGAKRLSALTGPYATLAELAHELCLGGATDPIAAAARRRGIPVYRIDAESLVQLGEGALQQRICKAITGQTSHVAVQISNDKSLVRALWSKAGIPIADGRLVRNEDDALRAAAELGGAVVVKPRDADYGRGVTLNLVTESEIRSAYVRARERSERGGVIVERFLCGSSHRLLVVAGRLVAGVRREPANVVGDGVQTIGELVEQANGDIRRGGNWHWPLPMMELGDRQLDLLARSGRHADSVPQLGERVHLSGHEIPPDAYVDVTDVIHPETRTLACEAVAVVGLDVAGLDMIVSDIGRPLREQQGGFLEINAEPAIALHLAPRSEHPRPVGEAIVQSLFPGRSDGRVPLVVMVGQRQAEIVADLTAFLLQTTGRRVGRSSPRSTTCGDRVLQAHSLTPPDRLCALMLDPRIEATVFSAPLVDIRHAGLGVDRCHVLVLADQDNCPDSVLGTPLLRRLMENAGRCIVCLDDRRWDSTDLLNCPELVLVATDADHPALLRHRDAGGFAAFPLGRVIAVVQGGSVLRHVTDSDWGAGHAIEAPSCARALAAASVFALDCAPRSPGARGMGHTRLQLGSAVSICHG